MTVDVYTKKDIETRSREHVIPAFLGGRLKADDIIDKKTNDALGHSIDACLSKGLHSIRVMCDARNEDGNPATPIRNVDTKIGKVNVESGGVVKPIPIVREFFRTEEGLRIDASVPDEKTLRAMLKKESQRRGLEVNALFEKVKGLSSSKKEAMPPITLGTEIWIPECYRATAKIACNLLALHHPILMLSSSFDPIRSFVWDGKELPEMPVQVVDVDISSTGIGELDHLVKIFMTPNRELHALVVYFGTLSFVVRLAGEIAEDVQVRSYRICQLTQRDRIDHSEDLDLAVPLFEISSSMTYEESRTLAIEQMRRCIPVV